MSERAKSALSSRGVVFTLVALAWPVLSLGEPREAKPLYTLDRQTMPHIDAVEYTLKDRATNIFAVPERNAVGTNSYHNAITILDLSGKKVKYREVRRNFKPSVGGGDMVFLPEFSRDTIGYSQTRGFLLFNVKTGEFKSQLISRALQEAIADVAVLDWKKKLFLFSIDFTTNEGDERELQVVDLSGPEPLIRAYVGIKKEPLYAQLGRTTFYFTEQGGRRVLHALDERLQETKHPLVDVYADSRRFGETGLPRVHPSARAAVMVARDPVKKDDLSVWAITWRASAGSEREGEVVLSKLFGSCLSGDFRFSPDGKWLFLRDDTVDPAVYMVMPVDPALPHVFGPPILLRTSEGSVPRDWNGECAWISVPVSVVCSIHRSEYIRATAEDREVNKLLKWELSPANVKR